MLPPMRGYLTTCGALLAALSACSSPATDSGSSACHPQPSTPTSTSVAGFPAGTSSETLTFDGETRAYRVHVPPDSDSSAARPLVLMLHGGGGSAVQFQEFSSRMDEVADREGFITVYPDGTGQLRTWNAGACCGAAARDDIDDVGFIRALLDHLGERLCIDTQRVYASGMSNGGMMSHRLGCELSERIAAIAPVAGTNGAPSCTPSRAVPVMHVHGTEDGHVPWDGGAGCGLANVEFPSVPATIDGWSELNQCATDTRAYFEEGNGSCVAQQGCKDGADVVLCSIDGGGHSWPGGEPSADVVDCPADGPQSTTFHASEAIWAFFKTHPMPAE